MPDKTPPKSRFSGLNTPLDYAPPVRPESAYERSNRRWGNVAAVAVTIATGLIGLTGDLIRHNPNILFANDFKTAFGLASQAFASHSTEAAIVTAIAAIIPPIVIAIQNRNPNNI